MSGQGGSGGARFAGKCGFTCEADSYDCENAYRVFECNPTTLRCEDPLEVCDDNVDCIPFTSNWFTPCGSSNPCLAGRSCVDVGDRGRCAVNATGGGTTCATGTAPVSWPRFEAAGTAIVCQDSTGVCDRGSCRDSCAQTGCTVSNRGSVCNTTTGLWFGLRSSSGFTTSFAHSWGGTGFTAVPAGKCTFVR